MGALLCSRDTVMHARTTPKRAQQLLLFRLRRRINTLHRKFVISSKRSTAHLVPQGTCGLFILGREVRIQSDRHIAVTDGIIEH